MVSAQFPLTYSLTGGRSRLELHSDGLTFAAPLRGIPERTIELSAFRFFCIDRIQVVSLKQKLMVDFNADLVLSWEAPDASAGHVRLAVHSDAAELKALLEKLSEIRPSANLLHLPVPEALRLMKVPSRDRDVAILLGVLLVGALLIVGTILWMLRNN